jgi:hypothetical protein
MDGTEPKRDTLTIIPLHNNRTQVWRIVEMLRFILTAQIGLHEPNEGSCRIKLRSMRNIPLLKRLLLLNLSRDIYFYFQVSWPSPGWTDKCLLVGGFDVWTGVNFINFLRARFLYKIFGAKISNPKASFVVFGAKTLCKKRVPRTLMKLTTGRTEQKDCHSLHRRGL